MKTNAALIRDIFKPWQQGLCPGGQVYVARKGDVIFAECFGYADIEHHAPITENTVFHVASVAKQITSMSVLLLHERGLINIDADIRDYIPDLVAFGEPVTVKDLLNNTSGIRDQWDLQLLSGIRFCDNITQSDLLELISRQKSLNFPPRSRFLYSNTNFTLLAEIVKRVSGMSHADFAKKNIFDPLGMQNSFFRERYDQIIPHRAMSYMDCWDQTYYGKTLNYSNQGATSLHTTAPDFLKWMQNFRNPVICTPETLKIMLTVPHLTSDETTTYACGIFVCEDYAGYSFEGHTIITHAGGDEGYRSVMLSLPEEELDIVIFSNVENVEVNGAAFTIAQVMLGQKTEPPVLLDKKLYRDEQPVPIENFLGERLAGVMDTPIRLEKVNDDIWFLMGDKRAVVSPLQGNCYEVLNSPYKLYIVDQDIYWAYSESGSIKLSKPISHEFCDEDLMDIPGIYYCSETESHFEIMASGKTLMMRHKRFGQAAILPAAKDMYVCRLEYYFQFTFMKNAAGKVTALKITTGRITGIVFEKVTFCSVT